MRNNKRYSARVDKGKIRSENEDQAIIIANSAGDLLMVVADGMNGHVQGELASKIAVEALIYAFRQKKNFISGAYAAKRWLRKVIKKANTKIYDLAHQNPEYHGMGTTLTVALILRKKMIVANIGDSRAYKFNQDNQFTHLTEDQTYVGYLIKSGKLVESERATDSRRHLLTNALGTEPRLKLVIEIFPYANETILLCSDGLYHRLNENEITSILSTNDSVDQKVESLINLANYKGGDDNIGIALMEVKND